MPRPPLTLLLLLLAAGCASDDPARRAEATAPVGTINDWQAHAWLAPQPVNGILSYSAPAAGDPAAAGMTAPPHEQASSSEGWLKKLFKHDRNWWPFGPSEPDLTNQPQKIAPDPF